VNVSQFGRAAEYRRRAEQARTVAACMSLTETKQQLLELAQHLEVMAGIEEGERERLPLFQSSKLEAYLVEAPFMDAVHELP
jgi:hypothetical protein